MQVLHLHASFAKLSLVAVPTQHTTSTQTSMTVEDAPYLAILAMARNECPSYAEWLTHHRNQGFEHFYIIDNSKCGPLTLCTGGVFAPASYLGVTWEFTALQ